MGYLLRWLWPGAVADWRDAWRWGSTRILIVLAAVPVIWAELPVEVKALIPADYSQYILAAVALAGAIVRIRDGGGRAD